MDIELEKLQFLGICGIFQETSNLIHKWKKIFAQITLAFILPLSLLVSANSEISNFFLQKITHDQQVLQHTQKSTPEFLKLSDLVSSERTHYFLITIAYFIFATTFSLLATSAVVYAVASIYAASDVTFKHVIAAVPKAWRRLLFTFICFTGAILVFNFIVSFIIVFVVVIALIIYEPSQFSFGVGSAMVIVVCTILYMAAIWYLMMIWQMANVVSVLEDSSTGFRAMARAKALLKGKMVVATVILVSLGLCFGVVDVVFYRVVIWSTPAPAGVVGRGIVGIIWVLSFLMASLVKLVAETVLYFVCKSYHQESVDMSALSDHLQSYLSAGYVPLKVEDDVQVAKLQVV